MSTVLGFLHTSPVHVPTFDDLVRRVGGEDVRVEHVVDESLLADARRHGPGAVSARVAGRIDELVAAGAGLVCCTCSTIGTVAQAVGDERAGDGRVGDGRVAVIRVDRPMARRAVELGSRILVLAALESTLEPTRALLDEEARASGRPLDVTVEVIDGAWSAFETGDQARYEQLVARRIVDEVGAGSIDVVVLAQASMAGAIDRLPDLRPDRADDYRPHAVDVPVLASPRLAVEALLARSSESNRA